MTLGGKFPTGKTDAKGVSHLYRPVVRRVDAIALVLAMLVALVAVALVNRPLQLWLRSVWLLAVYASVIRNKSPAVISSGKLCAKPNRLFVEMTVVANVASITPACGK